MISVSAFFYPSVMAISTFGISFSDMTSKPFASFAKGNYATVMAHSLCNQIIVASKDLFQNKQHQRILSSCIGTGPADYTR